MTAAPNENWIETSLARLESLEAQREQLAAAGQTAQLAEIDEEIRGLYEALESVAGEDEDEPANEAQAAAVAVAAPPLAASPLAAAAAAPAAAPIPAPDSFGAPMTDTYDDFDDKPPGSKLPLILGALVLIGGGIGAFMVFGGGKAEAPKPKDPGPAQVIKAGEVVEDTQEPVVAKGADADRTEGTRFKESSRTNKPSGNRPRSNGSRTNKSRPSSNKDDGRKFQFEKGKDPLAGVE